MEKNLMVFEGQNVEVFEFEGKALFNPKHVAKCLELSEDAVKKSINRMNEKQVVKLTNSKMTNCHFRKLHNTGENFITESGVYRLIFKSRSEGAEKFQDWVTDEVLPQIRQTGGYIPVEESMSDSEIMARALLVAQKTIDNKDKLIQQQKQQLEEQAPKVNFANSIEISTNSIDFKKFSDVLGIKNFGRNTMMRWFRNQGYLTDNNEPYRRYMEQGLFETKESSYETIYGTKTNITTFITGKGQLYFQKKIDEYFNINQ